LLRRFETVAAATEDAVLSPLTASERATLARLAAKASSQVPPG
jgi:hypothetical protein